MTSVSSERDLASESSCLELVGLQGSQPFVESRDTTKSQAVVSHLMKLFVGFVLDRSCSDPAPLARDSL